MGLVAGVLAAGCADGQSYVHVTVTGDVAAASSIDRFEVRATNQGQTATVTIAPTGGAPIALPFDFALTFDAHRRGLVDVTVDAMSGGVVVATGEAMVEIAPSHGTALSVALSDVNVDLGGAADLSTVVSDLAAADLAPGDMAVPVFLGDNKIEGATDTHAAGLADASNFVASTTGNVHSLTVYYDSGDAIELLVGLYDDAGNHPHNLLAQGSIMSPTVGAWNAASIPSTAVVAGQTYWIALVTPVGSGTVFSFRYGSGASGNTTTEHSTQSNLTALPASWSTGQTFPGTFCSFYASP